MGPLDFLPLAGGLITSAMDRASGQESARMSRDAFRHRYQDTVADMRKAGLNPALAYGQGGGSGALNQTLPEMGQSFARGVSAAATARENAARADLTGAQAALLKAQSADLVDQISIRNQLLRAQTGATGAQAALAGVQADRVAVAAERARLDYQWASETQANRIKMVEQELRRVGQTATKTEIENTLLRLQKPEAEASAAYYGGLGKYDPYVNKALDVIKTLMPTINLRLGKQPVTNVYPRPRR